MYSKFLHLPARVPVPHGEYGRSKVPFLVAEIGKYNPMKPTSGHDKMEVAFPPPVVGELALYLVRVKLRPWQPTATSYLPILLSCGAAEIDKYD